MSSPRSRALPRRRRWNDWNREGILAVTNERVVFYAKKMGGGDLQVFPAQTISSTQWSKG